MFVYGIGLSPGFIYSPPGSCGQFLSHAKDLTGSCHGFNGHMAISMDLSRSGRRPSLQISLSFWEMERALSRQLPISPLKVLYISKHRVADLKRSQSRSDIHLDDYRGQKWNYKPEVGIAFGLGDGRFAAPVG